MDDQELRTKLTDAWRVVGRRLLDEGYDPKLVTETYMVLPLALGIGLDIVWDYWGFWR